MFEYEFESELQEHIINNFNEYFECDFIAEEVRVSSYGKRIDLLGEDENNVYIIEVKRDVINNKAIKQLKEYLNIYKTNKNKIAIAVAPKILSNVSGGENIRLMRLQNVKYKPKSKAVIKLNIDKELLSKVKIKAIQEGKNVNEIIEDLLQQYLKGKIEMTKYTKIYKDENDHLILSYKGIDESEYENITLNEFIEIVENSNAWDNIDSEIYESALKEVGLDYNKYDDPDEMWKDYLEAVRG